MLMEYFMEVSPRECAALTARTMGGQARAANRSPRKRVHEQATQGLEVQAMEDLVRVSGKVPRTHPNNIPKTKTPRRFRGGAGALEGRD